MLRQDNSSVVLETYCSYNGSPVQIKWLKKLGLKSIKY